MHLGDRATCVWRRFFLINKMKKGENLKKKGNLKIKGNLKKGGNLKKKMNV